MSCPRCGTFYIEKIKQLKQKLISVIKERDTEIKRARIAEQELSEAKRETKEVTDGAIVSINFLQEQLSTQQALLEKLVEALEFYSLEPKNKRATEALAEYNKEMKK